MESVTICRKRLKEDIEGRTREEILAEAAHRFDYFFKRIDGDFEYPKCHPQIQQVLDMVAMSLCADEGL